MTKYKALLVIQIERQINHHDNVELMPKQTKMTQLLLLGKEGFPVQMQAY